MIRKAMAWFEQAIDPARPGRRDCLRLWHDGGTGREALLALIETGFAEEGFRVVRDDGWRCYDLRIRGGPWFRNDLLTVTEYHEGGATLTRVRLTSRVTGLAMVAVLGTGLFAACVGALLPLSGPVAAALWGVGCGLWILGGLRRDRGSIRGIVERAGKSLGASVTVC